MGTPWRAPPTFGPPLPLGTMSQVYVGLNVDMGDINTFCRRRVALPVPLYSICLFLILQDLGTVSAVRVYILQAKQHSGCHKLHESRLPTF